MITFYTFITVVFILLFRVGVVVSSWPYSCRVELVCAVADLCDGSGIFISTIAEHFCIVLVWPNMMVQLHIDHC